MKVLPASAASVDPGPSERKQITFDSNFQRDLEQLLERYLEKSGFSAAEVRVDVKTGDESLPQRQVSVSITPQDLRPPLRAQAPPRGELAASHAWLDETQQNTSADRYWAKQPPEVQMLRYAAAADREPMAEELSRKGFVIDAPIMIWGWDPEQTMRLRQEYGYTWVPSAYQPQIPVAPGLSFPGAASYRPDQIPPGSVRVSLDFLEES